MSLIADPSFLPSFTNRLRSAGVTAIRLGQLAPQNSVLRLEVFNHPDHFRFGGPGQEQQQGVHELRHGCKIPRAVQILEETTF
jgi:hypothetical protein